MVNFTECAARYLHNATARDLYAWHGKVISIEPNETTQITLAGCKAFCGKGVEYYKWDQASSTITTWVLPVIGILLQAPFESNAFWKTCLAIVRWVGSPIVTLSYIFWNISVTGKCALMVDMSVRFEELPDEKSPDHHVSNFSSMRDSLYILTNMNQYTMKPISAQKEAEGLLRIVLFSKDLQLVGTNRSLARVRHELAHSLRHGRRRGVVPVFISTMWFLFSLAISIQGAFGLLGQNAIAHDLALGLLLSWLPVLILACIVDRNPVAAEDLRRKLNDLVDQVCDSLLDEDIRSRFLQTIQHRRPSQLGEMQVWVSRVMHKAEDIKGDFFRDFAGQGRIRWHYGAAHPILCDIEARYIAQHGRDWLQDEEDARTHLVLGLVEKGLLWFDSRELWQISSAILVVTLTIFGAFILSYFTPTVGLGCRSGGYLVFWLVAMILLGGELAVWWLTSSVHESQWLASVQRHQSVVQLELKSRRLREVCRDGWRRFLRASEASFVDLVVKAAMLDPLKRTSSAHTRHWIEDKVYDWHRFTFRDWSTVFFFVPLETFNTIWLIYMGLGQTFGAFVNCDCQCSLWAGGGGYLDLSQWDFTKNHDVTFYWRMGTILSTIVMGLGMIYIVIEWCIQSHLSTTNYEAAMRGLWRTRHFRQLVQPLRYPAVLLVHTINSIRDWVMFSIGRQEPPRNSLKTTLVWTKSTGRPSLPQPSPRFGSSSPRPDYTPPALELAESPFAPHRIRTNSGASSTQDPLLRDEAFTAIAPDSARTASIDSQVIEHGLGIISPVESPSAERQFLSPLDATRPRRDSESSARRSSDTGHGRSNSVW